MKKILFVQSRNLHYRIDFLNYLSKFYKITIFHGGQIAPKNKKMAVMIITDGMISPEPNPNPMAIANRINPSSSGSFIGVRKRTIDKAPIKPKESARDPLMITMMKKTRMPIIGKMGATKFLPVNELPKFL